MIKPFNPIFQYCQNLLRSNQPCRMCGVAERCACTLLGAGATHGLTQWTAQFWTWPSLQFLSRPETGQETQIVCVKVRKVRALINKVPEFYTGVQKFLSATPRSKHTSSETLELLESKSWSKSSRDDPICNEWTKATNLPSKETCSRHSVVSSIDFCSAVGAACQNSSFNSFVSPAPQPLVRLFISKLCRLFLLRRVLLSAFVAAGQGFQWNLLGVWLGHWIRPLGDQCLALICVTLQFASKGFLVLCSNARTFGHI